MTTAELVLSELKSLKSLGTALETVTRREKQDKVLVVLLDTSGSMCEDLGNSTKIQVAWKVLQKELMPRLEGWACSVLEFGAHVQWISMTSQSTKALARIRAPDARGGTPIQGALRMVWDWVKENAKQTRFVLITDGCPTDACTDDILSNANRSIPIDTVGIGKSGYSLDYDKEFLKELSLITGGIFVEADSVQTLISAMVELSPTNRPLLGTVNTGTGSTSERRDNGT